MSDILRILQIPYGDLRKAIHFAIRFAIQIAIQKRAYAIRFAIRAIQKAIRMPYVLPYVPYKKPYACHTFCHTCHTNCHTVWQKSHTRAIQKAIHIKLIKMRRTRMEKMKRTYRLSEQAVNMVENRNREKYPSATDFLEAKILAPEETVTELLNKIYIQLDEVKQLLAHENHENIEESKSFY